MKLSDDFVLVSFTIFVHVISCKYSFINAGYDFDDYSQSKILWKVSISNKTTIKIQFTNQYDMPGRSSCSSAELTGGRKNTIYKKFDNDCQYSRDSVYDKRPCPRENTHQASSLEVCTNYTITFYCTIPDSFGNKKLEYNDNKNIQKIEHTSIITSYDYPPLLPVKSVKNDFIITSETASYLNINWEEPDEHKLCIKVYYIDANSSVHGKKMHETAFPSFILTSLESGENYTGIVYGVDKENNTIITQPVEFTTPDNYVKPELMVDAKSQAAYQMDITWECNLQYSIEKYLVRYWPTGLDAQIEEKEIYYTKLKATISSLKSCTYYNVSVAPKTSKAGNDMITMTDVFVISNDTCMEITKNLEFKLKAIENEKKAEQYLLNIPKEYFVKHTEIVTNYSIIIRTITDDTKNVDTKTWSSTTNSWADTQLNSSILFYRTTPDNWDPFKGNDKNYVTYTIGGEPCSMTDRTVYCNGPLKTPQLYELILKVCSKYGCKDSKEVQIQTRQPAIPSSDNGNDNRSQTTPLQFIGLIFTVLLICVGLYYIIRAASGEDGMMDSMMRKSMPSDMTLQELISKTIEDMEIEYNLFDVFLKSNPSTNVAMLSKNRPKNRYSDILPYDYNRVELKWGDNDYINASLIHDSEGALKYIACQGPMPNTCVDMWQMVLEQNVVSIVMLCKLVENEKIKCDKYFPDANEQIQYGDIKVRNNNVVVNELSSSTISELTITKGNTQKSVSHYQYHDWPDFGTPEEYATLMEFCQNVNKTSSNSVIVVHCSAGVGRTGTYIACDLLKKAIYQGEKLNVFKTVLNLRKQRTNMVQTQDQYNFIYGYLGSFVNSSD